MHIEGPQIISFQNICDMLKAKIDRLAMKINSFQKTPQNRLFWWTPGLPLKPLKNLIVGSIKIERTRACNIFFHRDAENWQKSDFFGKTLQRGNFSRPVPTESPPTQDSGIEWSFYWAIFGDFWGQEPRLNSEISYFQNLRVSGDYYALYHFLCHWYT